VALAQRSVAVVREPTGELDRPIGCSGSADRVDVGEPDVQRVAVFAAAGPLALFDGGFKAGVEDCARLGGAGADVPRNGDRHPRPDG
jgi:hypothetical protein